MITAWSIGSSSGCHLSQDGPERGGAPQRRCCKFEYRKSVFHFDDLIRDFRCCFDVWFCDCNDRMRRIKYGNQVNCAVMLGLVIVESTSVLQCLKILRLKCWTLSVEPLSSLSSIPRIKIARRVLIPTMLGKDEIMETLWQVSS